MLTFKLFLVVVGVGGLVAFGYFRLYDKYLQKDLAEPALTQLIIKDEASISIPLPTVTTTLTPTVTIIQKEEQIILEVPFTSQAPFAEWSDPRQQDGCEEAASLMAIRWALDRLLTKEEARQEILAISAYQSEKYGDYRDTSALDTADRIIRGYFNYQNVEVKNVISQADIINELKNDKIVILPMNGQALNNPNFTAPGPERHMLVVIGYDPKASIFITNDPGIRQGAGYKYPVSLFMNAIRDYPTGYHVPIEKVEEKMIVISR